MSGKTRAEHRKKTQAHLTASYPPPPSLPPSRAHPQQKRFRGSTVNRRLHHVLEERVTKKDKSS
eukprot:384028-Hanusia_phi.AAC.1